MASVVTRGIHSGGLATSPTWAISGLTIGNVLGVFVESGQTNPVGNITDSAGHTWVRRTFDNGALRGQFFTTTLTTTSTTITFPTAANELVNAAYWECSGLDTTVMREVEFQQGTTTTAASSPTTSQKAAAGDIVLGVCGWLRSNSSSNDPGAGAFSPSIGSSTAQFVDNAGVPANHWSLATLDAVATAASTEQFTITVNVPLNWEAQIIVLEALVPNFEPPKQQPKPPGRRSPATIPHTELTLRGPYPTATGDADAMSLAEATALAVSISSVGNPMATALRAFMASAVTPCNILVVGDSLTQGYGAANFIDSRYLQQLEGTLHTRYQAGGVGFANSCAWCATDPAGSSIPSPPGPGTNAAFSFGGSSLVNNGVRNTRAPGGRVVVPATNETTTFTFVGTSCVLEYQQGTATFGPFTVTVDGGIPVTVTPSTTGGDRFDGVWTSPIVAHGSHTVLVTPSAGSTAHIAGALVLDGEETKGIRIWEHGHYGADSSEMLGGITANFNLTSTTGLTDIMAAGLCKDPALVIIFDGLNDGNHGISSATYQSNITSIIANIKGLCSRPPSFLLICPYDTAYSGSMAGYETALQAIAAADPTNVTAISLRGQMVGGDIGGDNIHPTAQGYTHIGSIINAAITGLASDDTFTMSENATVVVSPIAWSPPEIVRTPPGRRSPASIPRTSLKRSSSTPAALVPKTDTESITFGEAASVVATLASSDAFREMDGFEYLLDESGNIITDENGNGILDNNSGSTSLIAAIVSADTETLTDTGTVVADAAFKDSPPEREWTPPGRRSPASIPRASLANAGGAAVTLTNLTDTDSATLSEVATVAVADVAVDAVTAIDAAALTATEAATDAVTAGDVAAAAIAISPTDGSALAEAAGVAAAVVAADTQTTTDLAATAVGISIVDGSTIAEALGLAAAISDTDAETLTDTASLVTQSTVTPVAPPERERTPPGRRSPASIPRWSLANAGAPPALPITNIVDSDTVGLAETAAIAAATTGTESDVLGDIAAATAGINGTDGSAVAESPAITATETGADASTVADLAGAPLGNYAAADTLVLADTATTVAAAVAADSGTLIDLAATAVGTSGTDSTVVAETPALAAAVTDTDTDVLADSATATLVATTTPVAAIERERTPPGRRSPASIPRTNLGILGTAPTSLSSSDTGTLTETASVVVTLVDIDSGNLSESSLIGLTGSDTFTNVDLAAASVAVSPTDGSVVAESSAIGAAVASPDATVLSDLGTLTAAENGTDSAQTADLASIAATVSSVDTETLADIAAAAAGIATADVQTFQDISAVLAGLSGTDGTLIAETPGIAATETGADTETLTEASSVVMNGGVTSIAGTDAFALAEAASLVASLAATDGPSLADLAAIAAALTSPDLAGLVDLAAAVAQYALIDGATVSDISKLAAGIIPTDGFTLGEAVRALTAAVVASDLPILLDLAALAAALRSADSDAFTDSATVTTAAALVIVFGTSYTSDRLYQPSYVTDRPVSPTTIGDNPTSTVIASDQ